MAGWGGRWEKTLDVACGSGRASPPLTHHSQTHKLMKLTSPSPSPTPTLDISVEKKVHLQCPKPIRLHLAENNKLKAMGEMRDIQTQVMQHSITPLKNLIHMEARDNLLYIFFGYFTFTARGWCLVNLIMFNSMVGMWRELAWAAESHHPKSSRMPTQTPSFPNLPNNAKPQLLKIMHVYLSFFLGRS